MAIIIKNIINNIAPVVYGDIKILSNEDLLVNILIYDSRNEFYLVDYKDKKQKRRFLVLAFINNDYEIKIVDLFEVKSAWNSPSVKEVI